MVLENVKEMWTEVMIIIIIIIINNIIIMNDNDNNHNTVNKIIIIIAITFRYQNQEKEQRKVNQLIKIGTS